MNDSTKAGEPAKNPPARKIIRLGWNKPGQPPPDLESPPEEQAGAAEASPIPPTLEFTELQRGLCTPDLPPTTIKLTSMEPCGKSKVCITAELVVDVHRLAEVGADMLSATIGQLKDEQNQKMK